MPTKKFMEILNSNISLDSTTNTLVTEITKRNFNIIKENKSLNEDYKQIKINIELGKEEIHSEEELISFIARKVIEYITGKKVNVTSLRDLTELNNVKNIEEPKIGVIYEENRINIEYNFLKFSASGEIRTKDGKSFKFNIVFVLESLNIDITNVQIRSGSKILIDPLIIDLDGSPELLSDKYFEFDIDGNGIREIIPNLAKGKGFVFFDLNRNNKADPGEIIGSQSGNAFSDLKRLDTNNDGWVNKDDRYFELLKVWIKSDIKNSVFSMKDLNINALYTGYKEINFPLNNSKALLSQIGIYVKNTKEVRVLTKVDFVGS